MKRAAVSLFEGARAGVLAAVCLCLLVVGGVSSRSMAQSTPGTQSLRLTQAQFILSDSELPPPDSAPWQPLTLPDNWNLSRPGVGGFAWYRIEFTLSPGPQRLSALYVPRVSMNGAALLNGEMIGGDGYFDEPMSRQWYRPQLYSVPARLLNSGVNVIHFRIKTYANNKGGLSPMVFGAVEPVAAQWRAHHFAQVTSVQITSALTFGLGVLALPAWSLWRWNAAYGYFGASALLWSVRNTHVLVRDIPLPAVVWEILVATSLIGVMVLIFMFVLRFAGQRLAVIERLVWAFAMASPFLLWAAGTPRLTAAVSLCYFTLLLMGAYILKVLFDVAWRGAKKPLTHCCCSAPALRSMVWARTTGLPSATPSVSANPISCTSARRSCLSRSPGTCLNGSA